MKNTKNVQFLMNRINTLLVNDSTCGINSKVEEYFKNQIIEVLEDFLVLDNTTGQVQIVKHGSYNTLEFRINFKELKNFNIN